MLFICLSAAAMLLPEASAQAPSGYYDSANNKTGQQLRDALHDIIDDHHVIPYSSSSYDTHDALEDLDVDPNNPSNVILIYSGWSVPKSSWPDWNREHTWPQSYGTSSGPANTDMFHIYACDMNVNSSRGNKYYDNGGTNFHPEAPDCRYDTDSWEPRDEEKGDIARYMFYMDVRYNGDEYNELDLELTDNTSLIVSGSRFMGKLSTMLEWHENDPVDSREQIRNELIYSNIQYNRNPFVDNPSWVYSIWGGALITDTYTISSLTGGVADFTLDAGVPNANRNYFLLGSVTGTHPGLPLPGGSVTLPINWDVFTGLVFKLVNTQPFTNFQGSLDSSGAAAAQFDTLGPLPPEALGVKMSFAYCLYFNYNYVSNPVEIEIAP